MRRFARRCAPKARSRMRTRAFSAGVGEEPTSTIDVADSARDLRGALELTPCPRIRTSMSSQRPFWHMAPPVSGSEGCFCKRALNSEGSGRSNLHHCFVPPSSQVPTFSKSSSSLPGRADCVNTGSALSESEHHSAKVYATFVSQRPKSITVPSTRMVKFSRDIGQIRPKLGRIRASP